MCLREAISDFSVCLGNTSTKKTDEDSTETFIYYFGNDFGMPRHFGQGCDLVF